MKKIICPLLSIFLLLFFSCSEKNKIAVIEESSKQQSELLEAYCKVDSLRQQGRVEEETYKAFIEKALDFYRVFPEESITPQMLWSAGMASMTYAKYVKDYVSNKTDVLNYARKGIEIFDIIQKVYPDYENAKDTYFNRGVIYDDILNDYENAKYEFTEYMTKYPDSTSALQEYIQYLGATPDEIFQNFDHAD